MYVFVVSCFAFSFILFVLSDVQTLSFVFSVDKVCPTPIAPDNAMAIGNNTIGSTVTFLCKEGYFRLGEPFQVKCKSDGHWTKANVTCIGEILFLFSVMKCL